MNPHRELVKLLAKRSYDEGEFVLTSGQRSTFYVDVKRTTYDARGRLLIGDAVADWLEAQALDVDLVGGMTLGADAITHAVGTALAARGRAVRECSVRKTAKAHGQSRLIEGNFERGDRALVLDDVVTTGGSTLRAIEALREAGADVVAAVAVVDREERGARAIAAAGVRFGALCTLAEIQATFAAR